MAQRIHLPDRFTPRAVPEFLREWETFAREERVTLTGSGNVVLEPAGVALLAAGVARRKLEGRTTAIDSKGLGPEAVAWLRRIDFFHELGTDVFEDVVRDPEGPRFVPLRRITSKRIAREVADRTAAFLELELPDASSSVLRLARFVLEELGVNVVQHTARPETGFGLAHAYPQERPPRFQCAFADCGVGFRESVNRNPDLGGRVEGDAEAIQLAVQPGFTGTDGRRGNAGIGLDELRKLTDLIDADLWILSGTALWHRRRVGRVRGDTTSQVPRFDGAWICFDGPTVPAPA